MLDIMELKEYGVGKKCIIVGGGTSVSEFNMESIPNDFVIFGVNDSALNIPKCDFLVYNDPQFCSRVDIDLIAQKMQVICTDSSFCVSAVHYKCKSSFFKDHGFHLLHGHGNTGAKMIVIASVLMGFDEVYLIGFDCYTEKVNGLELSHFHGDAKYGEMIKIHKLDIKKRFLIEFDSLKGNVKNVFNLNSKSKIHAFPFKQNF